MRWSRFLLLSLFNSIGGSGLYLAVIEGVLIHLAIRFSHPIYVIKGIAGLRLLLLLLRRRLIKGVRGIRDFYSSLALRLLGSCRTLIILPVQILKVGLEGVVAVLLFGGLGIKGIGIFTLGRLPILVTLGPPRAISLARSASGDISVKGIIVLRGGFHIRLLIAVALFLSHGLNW